MSEDFEGKLQDEGKKEGEEGDEDENDKDKDDDDDAGQEMGDTGAEAEALDKEVKIIPVTFLKKSKPFDFRSGAATVRKRRET